MIFRTTQCNVKAHHGILSDGELCQCFDLEDEDQMSRTEVKPDENDERGR